MAPGTEAVLMDEGLAALPKAPAEGPLEHLVRRIRGGETDAFEPLMAHTEGRILALAWRILGDRHLAEDAAQETYLRIFRSLNTYRLGEPFEAWMIRIAVNACHDLARKRGPLPAPAEVLDILEGDAASMDAEASVLLHQRRALVRQALAHLPQAERAALVLRDLEGLPTERVAQILGVRPVTIRSQVASDRNRLRRAVMDQIRAEAVAKPIRHFMVRPALLAAALPAFGQQTTPAPQAVAPKEPDPDPAMLRAMKSKVFVLQHRDSGQLVQSLHPLRSGVRGSTINYTNKDGFNTISVRDFPENLATIEEAIKRLDVPSNASPSRNVELHLHMLFASKVAAPDTDVPEELHAVLKTLKGTLAYRSYTLAASFVQRTQAPNQRGMEGSGQVALKASELEGGKIQSHLDVDWSVPNVGLEAPKEGSPIIQLRNFYVRVHENKANGSHEKVASFNTDLSIKEGERVVVGTSVIKDRGLIVVLTARFVN